MPITLTVEDGSGLLDANSYVDLSFADEFHSTNPHSTWPEDEEQKKKGLITASRMLDQQWVWNGYRTTSQQSLQWPREEVRDPDARTPQNHLGDYGFRDRNPSYLRGNEVPAFIKRATAALAAIVLGENREVEVESAGLNKFKLDGVLEVEFNNATEKGVVPEWITSELLRYGRNSQSGARSVRIIRA